MGDFDNNDNLTSGFKNQTAENAYDVHVVLQRWDGEVVDQAMNFDPATAIAVKGNAGLLPLDTAAMVRDGVLPKADGDSAYYSFDRYASAVTDMYNDAMQGAALIHNQLLNEVDPGSAGMTPNQIDGVGDINELHWEGTSRFLQSLRDSVAKSPMADDLKGLVEQADIALTRLEMAGSLAEGAATLNFQHNLQPPSVEMAEPVQPIDFSQYEVGGMAGGAAAPAVGVQPK